MLPSNQLFNQLFNHYLVRSFIHVLQSWTTTRSDVRAKGFWSCRQQHAYFDVKVFNPIAPTYHNKSLQSCYRRLEAGKRHAYQDRILNVEHGSFSPLIFSTSGGLGPSATTVYRRLVSLYPSNGTSIIAKVYCSSDVRLALIF